MSTDLTFITNEPGKKLLDRFASLIKDTRFFDCLVGYFYTSGFYSMYKSLEKTEKIRILVGISTDKQTYKNIQESKKEVQESLKFSSKEAKEEFSNQIIKEMEESKDSYDVEEGIRVFIDWLRSKKLEIRAYPTEKIHAKVYIMTFKEGDRDIGRVITGSSNFTEAGLRDNIEFNVELKNSPDYNFALNKFNELWENSVDVSEKYVNVIKKNTWLNDSISPYELYLKFLYEYLKEKINLDTKEITKEYLPANFMDLEYQKDAVNDALLKLGEYGGVFISDVVGLGKTFISAMLALQLDGGHLVIAPPVLIDKNNPGSWRNVFFDFGVRQAEFESIGMLDKIIQRGTDKYKNIFIDESHRFRTENTQMYEKLAQICRGKRVILISATPLNNTPLDILSQIKLFQNAHKSTLPSPKVKDLEKYFKRLQYRLKGLDRQSDKEEYLKIIKENAQDIRENILQYLMIRRTRSSIMKYYTKDLKEQRLKFPDVEEPKAVIYNFDEEMDRIFNKTLELIVKEFRYARYTPLLYLKQELSENEKTPQRNMGKFMKILLLKRLESSFFAFKQSINRFISSYKKFIDIFGKGKVYVSKKHINKIFELLEDDDMDSIQKLIEDEKADEYPSKDFTADLIKDLESDLKILEKIENMWRGVIKDPKLDKFISILKKDETLSKNKLLVFTESKETAEYLETMLKEKYDPKVISYSSKSGEATRDKVIDNFDAKARHPKDEYRVLVSTEILSEGVNLHRSNVVINYDIPWNPTKMMQRVGRINRVDSKFDTIYTYNFFPAGPVDDEIKLKGAAEAKIKAFIEMLGNDARLLTDEEIKSHDLFMRLNSKRTVTGEDEEDDPELQYLAFLRNIRDNHKELFEKIKRLPKKGRTARKHKEKYTSVITFFRKGKLRKIFQTKGNTVEEVDFFKGAEILKAEKDTKTEKIDNEFYKYLEANKKEFDNVFVLESEIPQQSGGSNNESRLIKRIKAITKAKEFTDEDEEYVQEVLQILKDGALPKATVKKLLAGIKKEINPLKILAKLRGGIAPEFFKGTFVASAADTSGPKEVILSEYLIKNGN